MKRFIDIFRGNEIAHKIETISIIIFAVISLILIIINQSRPHSGGTLLEQSEDVEVYASAMPNQGWAPLTVYSC
ncbi:MAG: hypothetical protein FVQ83_07505 [Chloroflexi bacterium]|nr:hypothetical protein [Chloroflexota bacterium]